MVDLNKFFYPKIVAVIGASDHENKVGGILMKKLINSQVEAVPVNPKHEDLFGRRCYKSILDFKGSIDLAVIALPKEFVYSALEECGRKNVKNVIIISAGFSEVGDKSSEEKLMKVAKKYGIRIMGPNCFGIFNSDNKLDLTFSKSSPFNNNGEIAFISQSGALWSFIADYFYDKKLKNFVGLGNMADLEFPNFIELFSKDKKIKKIILYIEKLKDGKRFMEISKKAIKKGKEIYAVKAGSSEVGSKAAFSHTASLASDYEIYKGMFKQVGIKLCSTLEEAFSLNSMGKKKKISSKNFFIVTNAGGAGALVSDYLSEKNKVVKEKPLDILGTAISSDYAIALEENKNKADSLIVILTPQSMSDIEKTAEVILNFKKENKNKEVIALFLGRSSMKESNDLFEKYNKIFFNNFLDFKNSL